MRGTVIEALPEIIVTRITPACAGNSFHSLLDEFIGEDHPRVCGEQRGGAVAIEFKSGSPPRVRGTERGNFGVDEAKRITPACAGNRLKKARHFYILFCQIKRIHLV